ncbi:MAG: hypothetical protein M3Y81_00820 [Chloroflexota bacterium]|nr:hypothetical protein [Chloroflexota bacterium]
MTAIYPAEVQHYHDLGLDQPRVAQRVQDVVARGNRSSMVERDDDVAKDNSKEDVGEQPGDVRPAVDKLPPERSTGHRDIKAQHAASSLNQGDFLDNTKTRRPLSKGGPVSLRDVSCRKHADTRDSQQQGLSPTP